jgi:hypothetical protein
MPGFSLKLDKVRISCREKKIQLSVESSAFFNCSDGSFHSLGRLELLELLSSGRVWVSRGNNYRLDFQVLFNGQRCPQNVTEILGYHIRNAPVGPLAKFLGYGESTKGAGSYGLKSRWSLDLSSRPARIQRLASLSSFTMHFQKMLRAASTVHRPWLPQMFKLLRK